MGLLELFTMADAIVLGSLVFMINAVAVAWMPQMLRAYDIIDRPNARSSHVVATPRGGGLPLALTLTCCMCWLAMYWEGLGPMRWLLPMGAAGIALCGLADDLFNLSVRSRLVVQLSVVVLFLSCCMGRWTVDGLSWLMLCVTLAIAAVWMLGLTNCYNFMDGIDGMAAGQALVAGTFWMAIGAAESQTVAILCGGVVVGASLGFLIDNWHPARIFMGDVGSLSLGFSFAIIPLLLAESPLHFWGYLGLSLVALWPFVTDTFVTFCWRAYKRERVWQPHKSHFYQRLHQRGWPHHRVSMLYMAASATSCLVWVWMQ